MVFLINSIPIIILIVMGLVIRYAVPSYVGKIVMSVITIFMLVIYFQIQPSYIPKGTVKALPVAEFKASDSKIVDRSLKPKSSEYYQQNINQSIRDIDESIEKQIQMNKEK